MLIVNQYNVIPIKEKNKKAQLDSLELSSSKVPYIRINRDAPARDPYTGFLYAGAPVPQSRDTQGTVPMTRGWIFYKTFLIISGMMPSSNFLSQRDN